MFSWKKPLNKVLLYLILLSGHSIILSVSDLVDRSRCTLWIQRKLRKYQNTNKGFWAWQSKLHLERIKTVNVAIIPFGEIRFLDHHIKCYMRNVTIRKTWKAYFVKKCVLDKIKFVDYIDVDMLEVCGICINGMLEVNMP